METCTAGSASGLGKRTSSNAGTAPQADSSERLFSDQEAMPALRPGGAALNHCLGFSATMSG
jgi:hypothetical protein